jgi:hypothetical protein
MTTLSIDTPETQEAIERWRQGKINIFDEMARLERERDDYMERCRNALSERDSWRMRAEQKYAMRRELEELLGVDRNDASDEQFQKGLDSLKNIIGERDEAKQVLQEIANASHFDNIGNFARNKAMEALKIKQ